MRKEELLQKLRHQLIVSCQSSEGNPLFTTEHMVLLAQCSNAGGCNMYRVDTPAHIKAIKGAIPNAIIIGIWKVEYPHSDVYITPTMKEVDDLIQSGVDILAVDGTNSLNPNGEKACTFLSAIKRKYPDCILMADVATVADAIASYEHGADIISTTLHGYTKDTKKIATDTCDIEFIKEVRKQVPCFLIAEGKLWTREDMKAAIHAGADAVVIGTAINNPKCITERFMKALKEI